VRVIPDGIHGYRFLVLADDAEDHAATLQVLDGTLKIDVRFTRAVERTQLQSIASDIANDAAP